MWKMFDVCYRVSSNVFGIFPSERKKNEEIERLANELQYK